MKMRRLFHPCFLLFILLTVSCSSQVSPTIEPITPAPPVHTVTPSLDTTGIHQTATADWMLFQSTLMALKTQVSVFQTPTPTPTRTRIPPTATAYVTPRPTMPGEAKFDERASWGRSNSPDMQWFWRIEILSENQYQITHIVSADGSREFFVHPEEGEVKLSNANYTPYFWHPDGKYVYMSGNGCCIDTTPTHYWIKKLVRLDLETGQVSTVLPWTNFPTSFGYSVGFSPDGKYMVWSTDWKSVVHIVTLQSGQEILARVDKSYSDLGNYDWDKPTEGWSPDGKNVILESYDYCQQTSYDLCIKAVFVVISAETGASQVIRSALSERIDIYQQNSYRIRWLDDTHVQLIVDDAQQTFQVNLP